MSITFEIVKFKKPTKGDLSNLHMFNPYGSIPILDDDGDSTGWNIYMFRVDDKDIQNIINSKYSIYFCTFVGNFNPSPVSASLMKFFHPQPYLDTQNITNTTEPRGRILLDTIKSSRSIMLVPAPRGCMPDSTLNPSTAGRERRIITTIFTATAFPRLQPFRSME